MKKPAPKVNSLYIWCIVIFFKILSLTWRKKVIFSPEFQKQLDEKKPIVVSYYHKHVNALVYIAAKFQTSTIASDSKDGQLITQVLEALGVKVARGSSRHNPIKALKGLIRIVRSENVWATIAVDGPKGPPEKVKPGITQIAKILKAPIFVASAAANSKWVFKKSWDQTELPKPFAKVVFLISPGIPPLEPDTDPKSQQLLTSLEKSMSRNEVKALGYL